MTETASPIEVTAERLPIVELKSGLRVMNFSSPHPFQFDDGSVLPAVDPELSRLLSLERVDEELEGVLPGTRDILVKFKMSAEVQEGLRVAEEAQKAGKCDLILIALPVKEALKESLGLHDLRPTPFRGCIITDRVEKIISANRFSV